MDPVGWINHTLGVELWARQREIAEALAVHNRVAVRSSNAVGKSFLAASLALWYSECYQPSYVITTSSSWPSVEKVMWPTIRKLHRNAIVPLGGKLLGTEWQRRNHWGVFSVSVNQPENFGGYRPSGGVFVIVDEASSLEPEIYDAIMGLVAGANSKVLMIGNPLRPSGPFFNAFRSPIWSTHHISALESPNVVSGREIIPGLATRAWIAEREEEWGLNSPQYNARVLGQFPEENEHTLIPLLWLERAMEIADTEPEGDVGPERLGVDVAWEGDDANVLVARNDKRVTYGQELRGLDPMQTAGKIIATFRERMIDPAMVGVDAIGFGGGTYSRVREQGFGIRGVKVSEGSNKPVLFANKKAQYFWGLRERLNPDRGHNFGIPRRFKELIRELAEMRWDYTSKGQIIMEPKEEMTKRIGRSNDWSDALMLCEAAPSAAPVFVTL